MLFLIFIAYCIERICDKVKNKLTDSNLYVNIITYIKIYLNGGNNSELLSVL